MLVELFGSAVFGVDAHLITIEVNVDKGIGYHLVGLPDNAIKESNYRIAAALHNIGYKLPGKKITINMAPADLRKEGSAYDLPIALGILSASNQILTPHIADYLIMGEIALVVSINYMGIKITCSGSLMPNSIITNDYFFFHQANAKMLPVIASSLMGKDVCLCLSWFRDA